MNKIKFIDITQLSSYFFKDENLKKEFSLLKADKVGKIETAGEKKQVGYFAKYNAIATYERNRLDNIVFYMSAWQPEQVQENFESRLKNKAFNLYQINSVKIEKIY